MEFNYFYRIIYDTSISITYAKIQISKANFPHALVQ